MKGKLLFCRLLFLGSWLERKMKEIIGKTIRKWFFISFCFHHLSTFLCYSHYILVSSSFLSTTKKERLFVSTLSFPSFTKSKQRKLPTFPIISLFYFPFLSVLSSSSKHKCMPDMLWFLQP